MVLLGGWARKVEEPLLLWVVWSCVMFFCFSEPALLFWIIGKRAQSYIIVVGYHKNDGGRGSCRSLVFVQIRVFSCILMYSWIQDGGGYLSPSLLSCLLNLCWVPGRAAQQNMGCVHVTQCACPSSCLRNGVSEIVGLTCCSAWAN